MTKKETPKTHIPNEAQAPLFNAPKGIDLKPFKTIRIAVSGDVSINKLERSIVDTPCFQRLRRIKQLGTTHLVYPTAIHTRFDHALGTLSMAMKMVRAIRENKHNTTEESEITTEEEQLIRLLALLHDICHIPFGHTLEDEFCVFDRHDKDRDRIERFLGTDSKIGKRIFVNLGKDFYERFMRLFTVDKNNLSQLGDDLFIYDLVNNTVCADLLDYLRRDCYFCNVVLDTDYRFLNYLYLYKDGPTKRVAVRLWKESKPSPRRDILSGLIRLLDSRYLLGERVYFHHAKLISGAMVAGAVQRAKAGNKLRQDEMYELGDETLLDKLQNCGIRTVEKLVSGLRRRELWKQVYEKDLHSMKAEHQHARNVDVWDMIMKEWWQDPSHRANEEDRISELLGMKKGDFLIHCPDPRMSMKLAEMKVFWNGSLRPLKDCKDDAIIAPKLQVILDSHKNLWAVRGFMNPAFLNAKDAIEDICESFFNADVNIKAKHEERFYRHVVHEIAKSNGWSKDLLVNNYEKKENIAITNILSIADADTRNKNLVFKSVKDAFSK